jgi:hypothetical protein
MLRLSQAACDFPEIAELEINPLYVLSEGQGAYAVDVPREGHYGWIDAANCLVNGDAV